MHLGFVSEINLFVFMFARETKRRLAEAEAALGRVSDSQFGGKRQPGESERDRHDETGERERWGRMRVDDLRETEGRRHETAIPRSASANELSVAGSRGGSVTCRGGSVSRILQYFSIAHVFYLLSILYRFTCVL